MMVETILESSQEFGMSNGVLPQWKRELLQRRAARSRPAPSAPAPAPPRRPRRRAARRRRGAALRARDRQAAQVQIPQPRAARRPTTASLVLRRAASLEHLLDERPPPARARSARDPRRLRRLAPPACLRDETRSNARVPSTPSAGLSLARKRRPRRRRPRAAAPAAPADRPRRPPPTPVSAVLRGLESGQRSSTPEPSDRSPSPPAADISAIDEPENPCLSEVKTVSRAALEGIALAGSTVRYSFEAPKRGSHLPLVSASNPVLLGRARLSPSPRRVGVIRPMPAPTLERSVSTPAPLPEEIVEKIPDVTSRVVTPPPSPVEPPPELSSREKKETPSAVVEPIPRTPPEEPKERSVTPPRILTPETVPEFKEKELNGHADERPIKTLKTWKSLDTEVKKDVKEKENGEVKSWVRGGSPGAARRARGPAPAATSVVFNFSARKDVPDYIENDGIILRNKRDKIKVSA
ncbi:hypothetical protein MSG28_000147 [Choristoneura fumiferana]|uniref:Uncharacterized protein n=1 Tax=Choristoneura fumiferana TaxID=7141 RepID=A0ACC0JZB8_CHOFU|nr:hypothetical protein MSG28_000147 [Choristoneura fumiferana]